MSVRIDLNVSLDGIAATADGTPDNPIGTDWPRLVAAYTGTRTFRARVLGDTTGAGTTGVDDAYASRYFAGIGAEIMGAGMFGLHAHPDDPGWRGWWGDEPPFGYPVYVLTHERRASLELGATTFHFVAGDLHEVLDRARADAGGLDVRVGGGASVARAFAQAGLVDQLHVAVAPMVIGQGIRLWDGLRGLEQGYELTAEVAESGTTHLTFTRTAS